jgi:hypothetical protein
LNWALEVRRLKDPWRKLLFVPTAVDATFDLQYDGPALAEHEMDVRDLAPALLSIAELFHDLNRIVRPLDPDVSVNIRATGEGSFLVELKLAYDTAQGALLSHGTQAGESLGVLIGFAGSLIAYRRKIGRRRMVSMAQVEPPGTTRVTFEDGTSLEVPQGVLDASNNVKIRRDLQEIVRPLTREGVESMTLRRERLEISRVEKADVASFAADGLADERDVLSTSEREVYLSIRSAVFQEGNKWRFFDGESVFYASMNDQEFNTRIDAGEAFSKQDLLQCRVRETQWRDANGLHRDIEVLKVLRHSPAPVQLELREEQG